MEQRCIGELCGIFEERPQLHAAGEAREEPGHVQLHEVEDTAVYQPGHGDGRDRKSQFEHRAPGLAAFEIPGVPLAAGSGAAGGYAREEVDADERHGTCHQRAYGGEQGDEACREPANESV